MTIDFANYFDLQSQERGARGQGFADPGKKLLVIPQYLALVLGIGVQPFLAAYQATGKWSLLGLWGWVVFAVIVGLIIFPSVYKNSFDTSKPIFVQFCMIFAAGMGWESLLSTAGTVAGAGAGA